VTAEGDALESRDRLTDAEVAAAAEAEAEVVMEEVLPLREERVVGEVGETRKVEEEEEEEVEEEEEEEEVVEEVEEVEEEEEEVEEVEEVEEDAWHEAAAETAEEQEPATMVEGDGLGEVEGLPEEGEAQSHTHQDEMTMTGDALEPEVEAEAEAKAEAGGLAADGVADDGEQDETALARHTREAKAAAAQVGSRIIRPVG
jgi:hypothetical protein